MLKIKAESLPERCEICHQSDCFNPVLNHCTRCHKEIAKISEPVENRLINTTQRSIFSYIKELFGFVKSQSQVLEKKLIYRYLKGNNKFFKLRALEQIWVIGQRGALYYLYKLLLDKDWEVRTSAARTLSIYDVNWMNKAPVKLVHNGMAALKNENKDIRRAATELLGRLQNPVATRELLVTLYDPDDDVRSAALDALSKINDIASVDALISILMNGDWYSRKIAARTLGNIGDTRAIEPLLTKIKDQDWGLRYEVIEALGKMHDQQLIWCFLSALSDENEKVRDAAINAMKRLDSERRSLRKE